MSVKPPPIINAIQDEAKSATDVWQGKAQSLPFRNFRREATRYVVFHSFYRVLPENHAGGDVLSAVRDTLSLTHCGMEPVRRFVARSPIDFASDHVGQNEEINQEFYRGRDEKVSVRCGGSQPRYSRWLFPRLLGLLRSLTSLASHTLPLDELLHVASFSCGKDKSGPSGVLKHKKPNQNDSALCA